MIESLPSAAIAIGSALVAIFFAWKSERSSFKREEDGAEDRIRALLKDEVEALSNKITSLEEDIAKQTVQIDVLKKNVVSLEEQNNILKEIFQGRDTDAVTYRSEGRLAMKKIEEIAPLVIENNHNTKEALKSIDMLYKAIEKHLKNLENAKP